MVLAFHLYILHDQILQNLSHMLGRIGCPLQFLHDFFDLYQLYAVLLFFKKPSDKKLIDIVCLILQIMKFDTKPPANEPDSSGTHSILPPPCKYKLPLAV